SRSAALAFSCTAFAFTPPVQMAVVLTRAHSSQWYFFDEVLQETYEGASSLQPFLDALCRLFGSDASGAVVQVEESAQARPLLLHIHTVVTLEPCIPLLRHLPRTRSQPTACACASHTNRCVC